MWNYISGLGMKVTYYYYNSQNQLTMLKYQNTNDTDYRAYYYNYDFAGRLQSVSTDQSGPPPDYIVPFAEYSYNENSQILQTKYNNNSYNITNTYNSRNWLTQSTSSNGMFEFTLGYLSNGNIATQYLTGSYRSNFPDLKEIKSLYSYDKSNRLKKTEKYSTKYYALEGEYSFDADGNFLAHTRSFNGDNFNYDYYPYTNRLRKVTGTENQFTYDYNGNMINDYLNENINISYDHRNLITEINRTNPLEDPPTEIKIRYRYDESGNRTRKTIYQSTIENPPPIPGEGDLPPGWIITKEEYFVRDAQGKEIAIYQGYELDFWNVWGMGNEGRIKSTGTNYFYLKDHLGSIRAVLNESNYLVQALDYDSWGFLARSWDTTATRYKFTGKERDNESTYDYFGARYYDSRIGRWGQTELLLNKYPSFSPFAYSVNSPLVIVDPDGKDPRRKHLGSVKNVMNIIKQSNDKSYWGLSESFGEIKGRYLFTRNEGIIDMKHFFAAAFLSSVLNEKSTINAGLLYEIKQKIYGEASNISPEDANSNKVGAEYGSEINSNYEKLDIKEFNKFLQSLDPIDPDSEEISRDNVYIPEDENSPELEKRTILDFLFPKPFYGMDPNDHTKEVIFK